jgi:DNA-binding PadR family transcriptional regulator
LAEAHKIEACRPRNWLIPVILLTLRERNSYGYELTERTAEFGFETLNPGTLYRTLRQMEREGLCESWWETSQGGRHVECIPLQTQGRCTSTYVPGRWSSTNAT